MSTEKGLAYEEDVHEVVIWARKKAWRARNTCMRLHSEHREKSWLARLENYETWQCILKIV